MAKDIHYFAVGDGASVCYYSDRNAGRIIKVSASGKVVHWRRDKAKLLNGPSSGEPDALEVFPGGFAAHVEGVQRYEYSDDPDGEVKKFSLRKDGRWVQVGSKDWRSGNRLIPGKHEHYDYNF